MIVECSYYRLFLCTVDGSWRLRGHGTALAAARVPTVFTSSDAENLPQFDEIMLLALEGAIELKQGFGQLTPILKWDEHEEILVVDLTGGLFIDEVAATMVADPDVLPVFIAQWALLFVKRTPLPVGAC